MKKLIDTFWITLAVALLLAVLAPFTAHGATKPVTCLFLSAQDFYIAAANVGTKLHDANDAALQAILKSMNAERATRPGMWPLEADQMVIAVYKWKHKEGNGVGSVMLKDGCVVPGSAKQEEEIEFLLRIGELGLSMDNFTPRT